MSSAVDARPYTPIARLYYPLYPVLSSYIGARHTQQRVICWGRYALHPLYPVLSSYMGARHTRRRATLELATTWTMSDQFFGDWQCV